MERAPDQPPQLQGAVGLRLAPAASRMVGADLLVNVGGSTAFVQRIDGAGAELWSAFADGQTIAEASATLAERTGASPIEVRRVVFAFAAQLIQANLAEPTW